jgi:hypothetical protein
MLSRSAQELVHVGRTRGCEQLCGGTQSMEENNDNGVLEEIRVDVLFCMTSITNTRNITQQR